MAEENGAPRDIEDEKKAFLKEMTIRGYKRELAETDYVVIKIAEAKALGEDTGALLKEYASVLKRRAELRSLINEAESDTAISEALNNE